MPDIFAFISYMFIMTFTPGPNNMMCLVNGGKFGFRQNLPFIAGLFVGVIVIMVGFSYLNFSLAGFIPGFKPVAEILGGLYMVYLAIRALKSDTTKISGNTHSTTFAVGVAVQFVNIKLLLYGLTITANFIIPYYSSFTAILLLCTFLACCSATSASCWTLFGTAIQRFFGQHQKLLNIGMALLLLYAALSISGMLPRIKLLFQ
ncbi:MAG: LysE family transporter [Firmicutes bacterium]|jgi:cysteine/O-acetylserine efflux protein|nr:LysE family transporter [Bacillota bacterium]